MRIRNLTALAAAAAVAVSTLAGAPAFAGTASSPDKATLNAITVLADNWYIDNAMNEHLGTVNVDSAKHAIVATKGATVVGTYAYNKKITDAQAQAVLSAEYNKISPIFTFAINYRRGGYKVVLNTKAKRVEAHIVANGKDSVFNSTTFSGLTVGQVSRILKMAATM